MRKFRTPMLCVMANILTFFGRTLPGLHINIPQGQYVQVNLVPSKGPRFEDTFTPAIQILPPKVHLDAPEIHIKSWLGALVKTEFGWLNIAGGKDGRSPFAAGLGARYDLPKVAFVFKSFKDVDKMCYASGVDGFNAAEVYPEANGIQIEISTGVYAWLQIGTIFFDTAMLGSTLGEKPGQVGEFGPMGGLYFGGTVHAHCWECKDMQCLSRIVNAGNEVESHFLLEPLFKTLSELLTGVFKAVADHSKPEAGRFLIGDENAKWPDPVASSSMPSVGKASWHIQTRREKADH